MVSCLIRKQKRNNFFKKLLFILLFSSSFLLFGFTNNVNATDIIYDFESGAIWQPA